MPCPERVGGGDEEEARSKASNKAAKARPNGSSKLKGRSRQKPAAKRSSAASAAQPEVVQLERDLHEALEQQAATSQALQMALEMRDAIGALTEKWRRLGHDIGFGIGIAHGYATLGTIGFEGRFDYAAIGTVSNVASRLCDEAKPGQILISPRVLVAVKDAVTVEAVGEFELKGIRRPIAAYNVLTSA